MTIPLSKNILRTACFLPLILYNFMEYDSFVTFALFEISKLSSAAGKGKYNLHCRSFIVVLALICISYTRNLVILKNTDLLLSFLFLKL